MIQTMHMQGVQTCMSLCRFIILNTSKYNEIKIEVENSAINIKNL